MDLEQRWGTLMNFSCGADLYPKSNGNIHFSDVDPIIDTHIVSSGQCPVSSGSINIIR